MVVDVVIVFKSKMRDRVSDDVVAAVFKAKKSVMKWVLMLLQYSRQRRV